MRLPALFFMAAFLLAQPVRAEESNRSADYEIRSGVGVRSMFPVGWMYVPVTLALVTSVDVGKYFRAQVDISPYAIVEGQFFKASFSTGVSFDVYGTGDKQPESIQVIIPALVETGLMYGELESGDGYTDTIEWVYIGPSSGVDLTYWCTRSVGFNTSLKLSYLFRRWDMDSSYSEDYSWYDDVYSFLDVALVFGIAF